MGKRSFILGSAVAAGAVALSVAALVRPIQGQDKPLLPTPPVSAGKAGVEIMRVADVRPGMKGYGLSVFRGTAIERFDVEVMSVLKKYYSGHDIILARVTHPVTDHAYVIHGMSGSPIYIEDKLVGALALGFSEFPKDPVCGIQPIEYMLADKDHPWENESASLPPDTADAALKYCKTPLFASGLAAGSLAELQEAMGPSFLVKAGGSAGGMEFPAGQEPKIEPGSSVGITMMTGDINLDGIGTVTYVNGDDVLVFGHPMLSGGQIELPMTTAFVHTVIADQTYSFKMGSSVKVVGTMLKDRPASVYGVMNKMPTMAPFTVDIENSQTQFKKSHSFQLAHHPVYTPLLLTRVPGMVLAAAEPGNYKDQTVVYEATLKFEGLPPIELKDRFITSVQGSKGGSLAEPVIQLMLNPYKKVRLEKAHVKLTILHRKTSASIEGAWLQAHEVKPGEALNVTLQLKPFGKEAVKQQIEIPLPRMLPDGDYTLAIMGGRAATAGAVMADMMQQAQGGAPAGGDAQGFEDLVKQIQKRHPANRIVARLDLPAIGVQFRDKKLENLPGSIFVTLASNPSAGIKMQQDRLEVTRDTEWFVEGAKNLHFQVRTPGQVQSDAGK